MSEEQKPETCPVTGAIISPDSTAVTSPTSIPEPQDTTEQGNADSSWSITGSAPCTLKRSASSNESSDDDYDDDHSESISDDEIDALLEAGLPDEFKCKRRKVEKTDDTKAFQQRAKTVLVEKRQHHFEMLPEGWLQVTHFSGMPVYLHRSSRVCTLSKPYYLGGGSARRHLIPESAIPCLSYRNALKKEDDLAASAIKCDDKKLNETELLKSARIETIQEDIEQSLTPEQVREYCKKVFKFKDITITRFKSWTDRRNYIKQKRNDKQLNRPTLPENTKLISFPVIDGGSSNRAKEWTLNPTGKSYVCILHEYVQHALKKQPHYEFTELENAKTPYQAQVSIGEMKYGVGYGASKKKAKSEAARATLEIIIPDMRSKFSVDSSATSTTGGVSADLSFFDDIKIDDPRITEFCSKTTEPLPYTVLTRCLSRNYGLTDDDIKWERDEQNQRKKNEYTLTVGKHSATVTCKNKRGGRHLAAQLLLQKLHPHLNSWGSLLRLYGNSSLKTFKEKKEDEQEITKLQSMAEVNQPNYAILEKLRMEMRKLANGGGPVTPQKCLTGLDI